MRKKIEVGVESFSFRPATDLEDFGSSEGFTARG